MKDAAAIEDTTALKAEITALKELLTVQEAVVVEQSSRLEQANEELAQREEKFRSISTAAQDAIVMMDGGGRISFWNAAAERIFGYSANAAIGKDLHVFLAPTRYMEAHRAGFARFQQTGQGQAMGKVLQLTAKRKDGTEFPVELSVAPIRLNDQWQAVGIIRDITERKRAEQLLRRYADDLEQANEDVKQFAYIVSHDLRSPLVNLKGFAAELRTELETLDTTLGDSIAQLPPEQARTAGDVLHKDMPEALNFIESSATRMDNYISALLKLSRLGRRELNFERIRLDGIVATALVSLAHQIEASKTKVTVQPLPEVVADRTAIEQIVGNILVNAVNYLDSDQPGRIEIGGESRDGETTFFVRDNGRGISEEDMPKVFAPFRRAGQQDVKGEGMGLTFVQALVRRHGGQIRCESKLGAGTTFTVTLPDRPAQGDAHE